MRPLLLPCIAACFLAAAAAAPAQSPAGEPPTERIRNNVASLDALLKSILSKEQEIARVQQRLQAAPDEITRAEILAELKDLKATDHDLNDQFEKFAVNVDTSVFVEEPEEKFDWQRELGSLLKPILAEVKSATAESREIGDLRADIDDLETRHKVAATAVENLDRLLAAAPAPELKARLSRELEEWTQRRDDSQHQLTALRLQLNDRLAARKSFLDSTTTYAQSFFRTRGMNLLFGVGAFCLVFFGVRFFSFLFRKIRPSRKKRSFSTRLGALLFQLLSVLGGLLAALMVFNSEGDWFLLGIVTIFLMGVAWAGIKTLPQYIETVKLILNIGAVREGERLMLDGTPWKVDSLTFSARLVNPLLDGGVQVLPVRYLVGLHSRPAGEKEEWFPCRQGDWVELDDGKMGRVAYQTPSIVQLVELGGSQVVYQTPAFAALNPRVLTTNFRITSTFGIDYRHQAECTTDIPARMQAKLERGLPEVVDRKLIKNVCVAFKQAAASSLDYEIDVDFAGDAAPKYRILKRAIARLLVEACNENNWTIPFQQITVHQALS